MTDRILCVVSHPDDETLGAGATLAKHVAAGDEVMVIIMADGVTSRSGRPERSFERRRQCVAALTVLGITQYAFGDWPDNRLDMVPMLELAKDIEATVAGWQPSIVYTHHFGDLNVDHRIVAEAVTVACRPQPGMPVKTLLHFEVVSSSEWNPMWRRSFEPTYFVPIEEFLAQKLRAFGSYHEEVRDWPHPRSTEGVTSLAQWRGASVGVRAAEAFMIGRIVK